MFRDLVSFLVPPLVDTEERERMVTALNTVIYAATLVWTMVVSFYMLAWHGPNTVKIGLVFIALLVVCILLVRKRSLTFPRIALPFALLAAVAHLAAGDLGLHDSVLIALPIVILMGALFLGKRGGVLFTFFSIAVVGYLCWGELTGQLESFASSKSNASDFFDISIMLCGVTAMLWALISSMSTVIKRARESKLEIAEAYARLQEAQRMAKIGSWELDLKTEEFKWSDERGDEVTRILEIDPTGDVLTYEAFLEMVHADDRAVVVQSIQTAIEIKAEFDSEFRLILPSGTIKWIRVRAEIHFAEDGSPLRCIGAVQDITAANRAREALQNSEVRYRTLFEAAGDAIFIMQGNTCIRCNSKALELFACTEADIAGNPLHSFSPLHQPDGAESQRAIDEKIANALKGRAQSFEWVHCRLDGAPFQAEVTLSPLQIHGDELLQIIVRDVTERKQQEAERRKLEAQLVQSQKMECVGRLAGGVAHDFSNLLTAIIGYSDMALTDSRDTDSSQHEAMLQIKAAGERAGALTKQLLAFARKQTLDVKVLDVNEMIRSFSTMLKRLIGEDIKLITDLDPGATKIKADVSQIQQVVLNLAVNARDAMPTGGILKIETGISVLDEQYAETHPDAEAGAFVTLTVSDTGTGMNAETAGRIFEPFFTTKEQGKGTGLGLSMVYGIVKQHGGHVTVYSEPGRGSTFRIHLPMVNEVGTVEIVPASPMPVPRGTETVLLVEDDAVVRRLAFSMLTALGYDVIEAKSARDATQIALRKKSIHLLLTDVIMPDLSGKAVYAQVSALHPETKVLYMSGYTSDIVTHHGIIDKDAQLLQKPFTQAMLSQKIRDVLTDSAMFECALAAS